MNCFTNCQQHHCKRTLSESLFSTWNKPFQNFSSGYVSFFCIFFFFFFDAVTCKLFFGLLLWPSGLDISHLSLRSTLHPSSLCSPPWRLTCMDCLKGLPSDVSLDSSKSGTRRGLGGEKGSWFWVFSPWDPSLLTLSRLTVSLHARRAVWQPSAHSCFSWPLIAIHFQLLTTARPCTITVVFLHPAL